MTTGAQAGKAHISKDGRTAVVSISVKFLQRGGRKQRFPAPQPVRHFAARQRAHQRPKRDPACHDLD